MQNLLSWLENQVDPWVVVGFVGQFLFFMRFAYQWIASEKAKKSTIPEVFWYFSLGGGMILLLYSLHKNDLVFILGQGLGVFIYIRNIVLVWRHKKTDRPDA